MPTLNARARALSFCAITICVVPSCVGYIGDLAGSGQSPTRPSPDEPGDGDRGHPPATCRSPQPGRSPLRRLTRREYNNTVRDLLGDTTRPADAFPADQVGTGFGNDADAQSMTELLAEGYFNAAKSLAEAAIGDAHMFGSLVPCDPVKTGEAACARAFIDKFGRRAFRRPPEPGEEADLLMAFTIARAGGDFRTGIGGVIQAALEMPPFLYRVELGTPVPDNPGVASPTSYEMASRLSYLLWGTLPDDSLFAAAETGRLRTKDEILTQARRMLGDPRAKEMVRFFHAAWLGLGGIEHLTKDTKVYPKFDTALASLFRQESERFIDYVIWEGQGDVSTLLTAPFTFVNAPLAKFYRLSGVTGDVFQKVSVNQAQRSGLLTQAGMMSLLASPVQSHPVKRGAFVLRKLLCTSPPDPPGNLNVRQPEPDPQMTTRELYVAKTKPALCQGCHGLINPIGFGFENFDGLGQWRSTENGKPVVATGEIKVTDAAGEFDGPIELAHRLAASDDVHKCVVAQWLTFAFGRAETDADVCTRAVLEDAFKRSGGKILDLILALTETDAFLYRQEVSP